MDTSQNLLRVFDAFSVADLSQPLLSFDDHALAERVHEIMAAQGITFAGVRIEGLVAGIVEAADLKSGSCERFSRPVDPTEIVAEEMSLTTLVQRLVNHRRLFVTSLGQLGGFVTRESFRQPPARMWLFGMVTLLEMRFSTMIERHCPGESWKVCLSPGRIRAAETLLAERSRRNHSLKLADCLQFADKAKILGHHDELRRQTRFQSKRQLENVAAQLQQLRNNLAHSQDIVTDD